MRRRLLINFILFICFLGSLKLYAQDCSVWCESQKLSEGKEQVFGKHSAIKFGQSPKTQPPVVYAEPNYTGCSCDHIFWRLVSDPNIIRYYVECSPDSSFDSILTSTLVPSTDSFAVVYGLNEGKYWYRVFSVDTSWVPSAPSNLVFSIQDFSPPVTSCYLDVPGEWITKDSLWAHFNASDNAGMDSVFLFYQTPGSSWTTDCSRGYPSKPVNVSDSCLFIAQKDNYYEFFIGAKDDAKAPDWYPGDTRSAGNSKKPTPSDTGQCHIKVDTHKPFSKVINLDTLYTSTNFQVAFLAYDNTVSYYSGIDTVWLYWNFNGGLFQSYGSRYNLDDTSMVEDTFDFTADSGDGTYCFYTVSKDKAGNMQDEFDTVCTRVFTDVRVDLTLFDLDDTLDNEYTGSCTVKVWIEPNVFPVDSFVLCENSNFIGCTTQVIYSSNPIIDTFVFSNCQDGLKTLYVKIWVKGKDAQDSVSIFLDTHPPVLSSFSLYSRSDQDSTSTADPEILVRFTGVDSFYGECGAILLSEDTNFTTSQIIQISSCAGEVNYVFNTSEPERKTVYGKLLDLAENESQIISASILLYESAHNYPNPFNPNHEKTNLVFRLKQDGIVKIIIYDLFGNSVYKKTVQGSKGLNDGRSNPELQWDGRNLQGEMVANGGYICILKIDEKIFSNHKIAVVK